MPAGLWIGMLALAAQGCADPVESAVAAATGDPASARLQGVRERGGHVCGRVNFRNADGRYAGYTRFVYDKASERALIDDPETVPAPVQESDPACSKREAYKTPFERMNCAQAEMSEPLAGRQQEFEQSWARHCG